MSRDTTRAADNRSRDVLWPPRPGKPLDVGHFAKPCEAALSDGNLLGSLAAGGYRTRRPAGAVRGWEGEGQP